MRSGPTVASGRVVTVNEARGHWLRDPPIGTLRRSGQKSARFAAGWLGKANGGEHAWTAEGRISGSWRSETETGNETGLLDV